MFTNPSPFIPLPLIRGEGIDFLKGASPLLIPVPEHLSGVSKRGVSLSFFSSPSPSRGEGDKGGEALP